MHSFTAFATLMVIASAAATTPVGLPAPKSLVMSPPFSCPKCDCKAPPVAPYRPKSPPLKLTAACQAAIQKCYTSTVPLTKCAGSCRISKVASTCNSCFNAKCAASFNGYVTNCVDNLSSCGTKIATSTKLTIKDKEKYAKRVCTFASVTGPKCPPCVCAGKSSPKLSPMVPLSSPKPKNP
jgi:hypothetical protein